MNVQILGLKETYATAATGSRQGLRAGDMRFTFIAKEELVSQVKEYAKNRNMSIRDAMEQLLTQSLEA